MFKVSSIFRDTAMQSLSPLAECSVNDKLVEEVLFLNQSLFQMINVIDPAAFGRPSQIYLLQQAINASNWPVLY